MIGVPLNISWLWTDGFGTGFALQLNKTFGTGQTEHSEEKAYSAPTSCYFT